MDFMISRDNRCSGLRLPAIMLFMLMAVLSPLASSARQENEKNVKKVLFIGDSMTGWLSERLNAYGEKNGFQVATVVWDGSTISKWANSVGLTRIIDSQNPDVIFVSLGMNELFEKNPAGRFASRMESLKKKFGDIPVVWIGPPSWPGKTGGSAMISFLRKEMGENRFFDSSDLDIQRQSRSNPHPSRAGMIKWMDSVVDWISQDPSLHFKSLDRPESNPMSRGKTFIYKRMKETL